MCDTFTNHESSQILHTGPVAQHTSRYWYLNMLSLHLVLPPPHHLTESTARGAHGRQLVPGVGVRLVSLSCVPAGLAVVAAHHIEEPPARCHAGAQAGHRHGAGEGPSVGFWVPPAKGEKGFITQLITTVRKRRRCL